MHPKYGWNGTVSREFLLIALIALVAFFHSTPGSAHNSFLRNHFLELFFGNSVSAYFPSCVACVPSWDRQFLQ